MQSSPSVSFVIFTYNSSDLISKCLEHLNNSFNYLEIACEVILVDNNSTDDTVKIVKEFSVNYNFPVKILINEKQGLIFSRIKAAKVVKNEYTCFIDDDNFVTIDWVATLIQIINNKEPDVIGCSTKAITDGKFPEWFEKYQDYYACGKRFPNSEFINHPLKKFWGAGLTIKTEYLKKALLNTRFLCSGRIGGKLLSGEDAEINYRLRLIGATFFNANELQLYHFIRPHRLKKEYLNKLKIGNGYAGVSLDIYRYLLTNKFYYKLLIWPFVLLLFSPFLSLKYRINYFPFALMRFKEIDKRIELQKIIKSNFIDRIT